jgi:hypothetical protein
MYAFDHRLLMSFPVSVIQLVIFTDPHKRAIRLTELVRDIMHTRQRPCFGLTELFLIYKFSQNHIPSCSW